MTDDGNDNMARLERIALALALPEAVLATDPATSPTGYGLGRHGWVSLDLPAGADDERWAQVREWARTSFTLLAPKRLARTVLEEDAQP